MSTLAKYGAPRNVSPFIRVRIGIVIDKIKLSLTDAMYCKSGSAESARWIIRSTCGSL